MINASLLSNFSIRQQILIGFTPIFLLLAYFLYSSNGDFKLFSQNFDELLDTSEEQRGFMAIERDFVELHRNVLVYSYLGYTGVLRKIEFIQQGLDAKFETLRPIAEQDEQIHDRFQRLAGHYIDYKKTIDDLVKKKAELEDLSLNKLAPLIDEKLIIFEEIESALNLSQNFEGAYITLQIEKDLLLAETKITAFQSSPDSDLIRETHQLIDQIRDNLELLEQGNTDETILASVVGFSDLLDLYQNAVTEVSVNNSIYLQLVNVVLAGKAAEIDVLAYELETLVTTRAEELSVDIRQRMQTEKERFLTLTLMGSCLGIISAMLIALGISRPVNAMATTLSQLANRETNIEIPGQSRRDEVGEMARSANAFKTLASEVEAHSEALEFVNSELNVASNELSHGKKFLELMMQNVPDMLFVKDSQFRIIQANETFLSVYPEEMRDSVLGTTTLEAYDPEEAEQFLYFDKLALTEGYSETEETIVMPDGQQRTLFTKKVRFENSDGETFILAVARDITLLKSTEVDLQESKERYEIATQGSASGLWDWNIKSGALYWSPLLKDMLGLDEYEIAKPTVDDKNAFTRRLHPDERTSILKAMSNHLNRCKEFNVECRIRQTNGTFFWMHIRGQAIWDKAGNPIRMAGSAADISSRKASEQLLLEANAELEEFAYRTSHDLRSPIVSSIALMDYSNTAIQEGNIDSGLEAINHSHSSLKKLNDLIEDIFQLTVIRNKAERPEGINLLKLVDDSLAKLAHLENFDNLTIDKDIAPEAVEITTKRVAFTTILENLLSNAVKYQDSDKDNSYLKIKASISEDTFVLEVCDNGLGIPAEQRENLFLMFKRFHPKVSFGSGLGMYLTKKCADSIPASIELINDPNETVFRLTSFAIKPMDS